MPDAITSLEIEETADIIYKALDFYAKKLNDLKESEGKKDKILDSDLLLKADQVKRTIEDLKYAHSMHRFSNVLIANHNTAQICEALTVYANYFEEMKKQLFDKLGVETELKGINAEIEYLRGLKFRLCK